MRAHAFGMGSILLGAMLLLPHTAEAGSTCQITSGQSKLSGLKGSIKRVLNDACQEVRSSYRITNGLRTMADVRSLRRRGYKPCGHRNCVHNRGVAADVAYTRVGMRAACQKLWGKSYGVRCYCGRNKHIHLDTTGVKKVMTGTCGVSSARRRVASARREVKRVRSGEYTRNLRNRYATSEARASAVRNAETYFTWYDQHGRKLKVYSYGHPSLAGRTLNATSEAQGRAATNSRSPQREQVNRVINAQRWLDRFDTTSGDREVGR